VKVPTNASTWGDNTVENNRGAWQFLAESGHSKSATVETLTASAPSNPGIPTFDDSVADRYWSPANPLSWRWPPVTA
jgi:hypothetical protein